MRTNKFDDFDLILSFDDAHPQNEEFAGTLARMDLWSTFFIETAPPGALDQIAAIHALGHTIGGHTMHHVQDLKALPIPECFGEIDVAKLQVERVIGEKITAFAYPRGRYNDGVVEQVKRSGFTEARTTRVLEKSFDDPFRLGTTIHIYNGRTEYQGRTWLDLARFHIDHAKRNHGTVHIWGHVHELIRDNLMHEFLTYMKELKSV